MRKKRLIKPPSRKRLSSTQKGKGLFTRVKKSVKAIFKSPSSTLTPSSRLQSTLQTIGSIAITSLSVGRIPVKKSIQGVLSFLSAGKYAEIKKQLKYDDVYHCYLVVHLQNGQLYKLEKNHIIELTKLTSSPPSSPLRFSSPLTLNRLFQQGSSLPGFWTYDPATNNCQGFVRMIAHLAHATPTSPEGLVCLQLQNADQLLKSLPGLTKHIPKAVTSLASWGDRVLHGDGTSRRPF